MNLLLNNTFIIIKNEPIINLFIYILFIIILSSI